MKLYKVNDFSKLPLPVEQQFTISESSLGILWFIHRCSRKGLRSLIPDIRKNYRFTMKGALKLKARKEAASRV